MRERIFQGLAWAGAILDPDRNRCTVDVEGRISTPESSVQIWVIPTQENLMIAKDAFDCRLFAMRFLSPLQRAGSMFRMAAMRQPEWSRVRMMEVHILRVGWPAASSKS